MKKTSLAFTAAVLVAAFAPVGSAFAETRSSVVSKCMAEAIKADPNPAESGVSKIRYGAYTSCMHRHGMRP